MKLPALMNGEVKFGDKPYRSIASDERTTPVFSIGDQVRFAKGKTIQAWHYVSEASKLYSRALGMTSADIESLEDLGGFISVTLAPDKEVQLIPKSTCGCPYGGTWEYLLQPRIENGELPHFGGGTTYIAALPPEINDEIIAAIKAGRATVKKGSFWP